MPNMGSNTVQMTTFGGRINGRTGPDRALRGPGPGLGRNPSRDERYILEWDSDGLIDWTEMSGDLQPYCSPAWHVQ